MQFYVLKKFFSPPWHFLMQKRRNKKISNYSVTSLLVLHPTKASLIMKPPYLSIPPTIPPTFHNQSVTSYHYLFPNKTFEKVRKNITTTYSTRLPTRAQGKTAASTRAHIFSVPRLCISSCTCASNGVASPAHVLLCSLHSPFLSLSYRYMYTDVGVSILWLGTFPLSLSISAIYYLLWGEIEEVRWLVQEKSN